MFLTGLNIMKNFILHETIVCDDKDPPWFNKRIKSLIEEGTLLLETFRNNRNNVEIITCVNNLNDRLALLMNTAMQNYYSNMAEKLQNTQRSSKAYWSLLKIFLNNKKIPIIPPLYHKNEFVIDFQKKAEFFNSFFVDQCSLISNSSELPNKLEYLTQSRLSSINFSKDDIAKMIQNLDPNKTHGHDQISIRILKLCSTSICKPLEIIFSRCLVTGTFPNDWKKGNVVPVFKKGDKEILKNYRPISLLPVCDKIFEKLIFNKIYTFFIENNLISPDQSGFKPGDSCINQLLSITHDIYKYFGCGYEVRGVFLDISKAFDKVWDDGIIFKLEQNGISGKLHKLLNDFLVNRKQRVVLNGQVSSWANVKSGVPQGSILGPLLFFIYINDLPKGLSSNAKLFADDTSLFSVIHDSSTTRNELNDDLVKINNWAYQWKMSFDPDPNKQGQEVSFSRKTKKINHPCLTFNKSTVKQSTSQKHLGLILDAILSFEEHLIRVQSKTNKTIGLLRKLQNTLPRQAMITIYKAFVRPHLDYGDLLYDQVYNALLHQKLEKIQYNACIVKTGAIRGSSKEKIYQELGLEFLESRRGFRKLCFFFKILKNKSPGYLLRIIPQRKPSYITRNSDEIPLFKTKLIFTKIRFFQVLLLNGIISIKTLGIVKVIPCSTLVS